jgi:hypothetical protein
MALDVTALRSAIAVLPDFMDDMRFLLDRIGAANVG